MKKNNILSFFRESCQKHQDAPAIEVKNQTYSYKDLEIFSSNIAESLQKITVQKESPFIGLFAHRDIYSFAGILGILKAGKAYTPLNPNFPPSRNSYILNFSQLDIIIVSINYRKEFKELFKLIKRKIEVIYLSDSEIEADFSYINIKKQKNTVKKSDITTQGRYAYLLFTSGSTGIPKGVAVNHDNASNYVNNINSFCSFTPEDRFSQTFDLTFDLSVHDLFVCWSNGSCLVVPSDSELFSVAKYIINKNITVWFSVPSIAALLSRWNKLIPNAFPGLRYSLFCGEPLTVKTAKEWTLASPNCKLYANIYGPTECTIGVTYYPWHKNEIPDSAENGITLIGKPFAGHNCMVVDSENNRINDGEKGELCISGPQVTDGYLFDEANTKKSFIIKEDNDQSIVWYKTGDIVRIDKNNNLEHWGRKDDQIKIFGYRIELGEIEHTLREISGATTVVALPYGIRDKEFNEIVAFLPTENKLTQEELITQCSIRLVDYMVPKRIFKIDEFPLNSNGKIDRKTLKARIPDLIKQKV